MAMHNNLKQSTQTQQRNLSNMEEVFFTCQYYNEKQNKWWDSISSRDIKDENTAFRRLKDCKENYDYLTWRLVKKTTTTEILSD